MKQQFFSAPDLCGVDETEFLESLKEANSKNKFNERMPKVGETVIFYPNPDDTVSKSNGADSCAAIVTRVWSSICVNLKVIPDHGPMQDRGSVTHHTANPAGYHFKFHNEVYPYPVNPRDIVFGNQT